MLQDQARAVQDTNSESFQVHQLTIMYRFEHTNHVILNVNFKSLQIVFVSA